MIKLNEAQSIRATYEQIVKRLKDERLGLDRHLAQLEKTLKVTSMYVDFRQNKRHPIDWTPSTPTKGGAETVGDCQRTVVVNGK